MDGAGRLTDAARIGPNAVLQLIPVLDRALGRAGRLALFDAAGVAEPAPDAGMLPEAGVARLHEALRSHHSDRAPGLARLAGLGTADYILAHRIPAPARAVIRALPAPFGARLLSAAISRHSWTFAGSGRFHVRSARPLTVEIDGNPLAQDRASAPVCHWHAAVFERLFCALVWPRGVEVRETACCACGAPACRFEIAPRRP